MEENQQTGNEPNQTDDSAMEENPMVDETTEPSLTDGLIEEEPKVAIPEGFDAEIFDEETRTLKPEAVLARLKAQKEEIDSVKKQAMDMRRKVSKKGTIPDTIEELKETWAPEERYAPQMEEEDDRSKFLKENIDELDGIFFDHVASVELSQAVKDFFMRYNEKVQILDGRTDDEKAQAHAEWIETQKKKLGDDAENIIKQNVTFVKNYGIFDDDERKMLLNGVGKSAEVNTLVMKFRKLFDGASMADIPVKTAPVGGLADDYTLAQEYNKPDTTAQRRWTIMQQRVDAGRTNPLPTI